MSTSRRSRERLNRALDAYEAARAGRHAGGQCDLVRPSHRRCLSHFRRDAAVEWAVVEVGLGGRLEFDQYRRRRDRHRHQYRARAHRDSGQDARRDRTRKGRDSQAGRGAHHLARRRRRSRARACRRGPTNSARGWCARASTPRRRSRRPISRSPAPRSTSSAQGACAGASASRSARGSSTPRPAPPRASPGAWSASMSMLGSGAFRSFWTARMCRSTSPPSCAISPLRPIFPARAWRSSRSPPTRTLRVSSPNSAGAPRPSCSPICRIEPRPPAGRIAGARDFARAHERGRAGREARAQARPRTGGASQRLAHRHRLALSCRGAQGRGRRGGPMPDGGAAPGLGPAPVGGRG